MDQHTIDLSDPTHPDSPYNPANWQQTPAEVIADFERMSHIKCAPVHHAPVEK